MQLKPGEISSILMQEIKNLKFSDTLEEIGYVISSGDGIARIYGLNNCMSGEMLEFDNGQFGMALNIEQDNVGCVILGSAVEIKEGTKVKRTKRVLDVPVGDALKGRVVNALGQPIDDKGEIKTEKTRPIESPAPAILERKSVDKPLQTGILALDSMIPIGRGQRELIIGDRQTGKTAIAIDTILNQKDQDVICIYVAIGQKASSVAKVAHILNLHGAMDYTIIVSATASESAALQYIVPYSACAMAEYFMYEGKDVLVVYDDLSKHAVAYRTLSLLLRRPPGREAYPGDVFYLHSRLLERSAKLDPKYGGGSITALPIIETQAGDISAYIPTNVISITDGQIFLESELFYSGIRPAINVGLSVSRVGSHAQAKAMSKVAGKLRLELAQYRELEVFAQFGSDLDKATQQTLQHGQRIVETIKQGQYNPLPMAHQVIIIFSLTNNFIDDIPLTKVQEFNEGLIDYIKHNNPEIIDEISEKWALSDQLIEKMKETVTKYKESFAVEVK